MTTAKAETSRSEIAQGLGHGDGPDVSFFTLGNGLDVVVIPDTRVPVATHMIWYRNGSADDPVGRSGIAHFLEHLMFKGTKKHPAGEFSKVVAGLGGQENAFTSYDYTAYFQRVPKASLATMMEFEADRMRGLILTDDVVLPERNVILEERRMRIDTDPAAQLSEAMAAALYVHHPYGTPVIGWMHEIEALSRQDALDYYRRFYTPQNAILVVAGDVTADEVRKLADNTYGRVTGDPNKPERIRPKEPAPRSARHVSLTDPKVEQPSLSRLYLVPSARTAKGKESFALDVLAEVLGGGATSYLYRSLVLKDHIAVNAGAWYMSGALDETRFSLDAVPAQGVELEALEKALDEALKRALDEAFKDNAIERAKTRLIAETIYARDSQSNLARVYGAALAIGETVADVERWPKDIETVTKADLLDVCERFLTPSRSVTGYLLQAKA